MTYPERWTEDAGEAPEALLDIPPDAQRERVFEIGCSFVVRCPREPATGAGFELAVLANGAQQWRRAGVAAHPGETDGLDYRFRRSVPIGEPLRVLLRTVVRGGVDRRRLLIEAEEV